MFLVDESWRFGQSSFSRVKDFISTVVSSFAGSVVGAEGVRFGVTVFGDVPRSESNADGESSFEVPDQKVLALQCAWFCSGHPSQPWLQTGG